MKNKRNFILYSLFFILFVFSVFIITNTIEKNQAQREQLFLYRAQYMKNMLNSDIKIWGEHYKTLLTDLASDKEIVTLFSEQKREELYNLIYSTYMDLQAEEPTLKILHFHNADSTSFLRMHNKDKFGDDLSTIRPLIESVHSSHKSVSGYESGRYGGSLRVVVPVFDDEKYIGALEIGLDPNTITKSLDESDSNVHFQFILHENSIKKLRKDNNISPIDGDHAVIELNKFFTVKLLNKILHSNDVVLVKQDNKEFYTSNVITIYDYQDKVLGTIVGAYDFTLENQRYSIELLQLFLIIAMASVGFIALIIFSTKKNS